MSELDYSGTIDVEVSCNECGKALVSSVHRSGNLQWLEVKPCEECMDKAYEDGGRDAQEKP